MENIIHSFTELRASEGMLLTQYVDGADIKDYNSVSKVYVPNESEASKWREITLAQDDEYKGLLESYYSALSGDTNPTIEETI